ANIIGMYIFYIYNHPIVIDQCKGAENKKLEEQFYKILGGRPNEIPPHEEDDKFYYKNLDKQSKLFLVTDSEQMEKKLICLDLKNKRPSKNMLKESNCYI